MRRFNQRAQRVLMTFFLFGLLAANTSWEENTVQILELAQTDAASQDVNLENSDAKVISILRQGDGKKFVGKFKKTKNGLTVDLFGVDKEGKEVTEGSDCDGLCNKTFSLGQNADLTQPQTLVNRLSEIFIAQARIQDIEKNGINVPTTAKLPKKTVTDEDGEEVEEDDYSSFYTGFERCTKRSARTDCLLTELRKLSNSRKIRDRDDAEAIIKQAYEEYVRKDLERALKLSDTDEEGIEKYREVVEKANEAVDSMDEKNSGPTQKAINNLLSQTFSRNTKAVANALRVEAREISLHVSDAKQLQKEAEAAIAQASKSTNFTERQMLIETAQMKSEQARMRAMYLPQQFNSFNGRVSQIDYALNPSNNMAFSGADYLSSYFNHFRMPIRNAQMQMQNGNTGNILLDTNLGTNFHTQALLRADSQDLMSSSNWGLTKLPSMSTTSSIFSNFGLTLPTPSIYTGIY